MKVRLCVLVVIYNRACEESPSIVKLAADANVRAVIVDNSTEENKNAEFCRKRGFGYVAMGGNLGLAKAYNRGIAWIKANTDATHVVLLDDDTALPDRFLEHTTTFLGAHPTVQIVLPTVYDEKGILSPCEINGLRVNRVTDVNRLTAQTVTGINSGMTVDVRIFDDYAYDEGYFLDYIDHAFLRDMKACGNHIAVTKQILQQRFADNAKGNRRAAKVRLKIFKKDFRRFCGTSFRGRLTAEAVIIKRHVKIMLSK